MMVFAVPTNSINVVPANAGTHTPRPLVRACGQKPSFTTSVSGYGSVRSQGRR
jgi:hypothetical protein